MEISVFFDGSIVMSNVNFVRAAAILQEQNCPLDQLPSLSEIQNWSNLSTHFGLSFIETFALQDYIRKRDSAEPLNSSSLVKENSIPLSSNSSGDSNDNDSLKENRNGNGKEEEKAKGKGDVNKKGKGKGKEILEIKIDKPFESVEEEEVEGKKKREQSVDIPVDLVPSGGKKSKRSRMEESETCRNNSRSSRSSIDVSDKARDESLKKSDKKMTSKDIPLPNFKEHLAVILPESMKGRRSERISEQEVN